MYARRAIRPKPKAVFTTPTAPYLISLDNAADIEAGAAMLFAYVVEGSLLRLDQYPCDVLGEDCQEQEQHREHEELEHHDRCPTFREVVRQRSLDHHGDRTQQARHRHEHGYDRRVTKGAIGKGDDRVYGEPHLFSIAVAMSYDFAERGALIRYD